MKHTSCKLELSLLTINQQQPHEYIHAQMFSPVENNCTSIMSHRPGSTTFVIHKCYLPQGVWARDIYQLSDFQNVNIQADTCMEALQASLVVQALEPLKKKLYQKTLYHKFAVTRVSVDASMSLCSAFLLPLFLQRDRATSWNYSNCNLLYCGNRTVALYPSHIFVSHL